MFAEERVRISSRLKDALVADWVVVDGDDLDESRRDLKEERDWTWHLARQLGFVDTYGPGGIHDTLMQAIFHFEALFKSWPLPMDGQQGRDIAHAATRSLNSVEVYATPLGGPKAWRKNDELPSTFSELDTYFRTALQRGLAASINALLIRWRQWDIPRLQAKAREAENRRLVESLPKRPTLTPEEQLQARRDRKKWREGASYQPPSRT